MSIAGKSLTSHNITSYIHPALMIEFNANGIRFYGVSSRLFIAPILPMLLLLLVFYSLCSTLFFVGIPLRQKKRNSSWKWHWIKQKMRFGCAAFINKHQPYLYIPWIYPPTFAIYTIYRVFAVCAPRITTTTTTIQRMRTIFSYVILLIPFYSSVKSTVETSSNISYHLPLNRKSEVHFLIFHWISCSSTQVEIHILHEFCCCCCVWICLGYVYAMIAFDVLHHKVFSSLFSSVSLINGREQMG